MTPLPHASWLKPREPFAGLAVVAVAGILAGDFHPLSAFALGVAAVLSAGGCAFRRVRPVSFWFFVFCCFALLHVWRTKGTPADFLAGAIGDASRVVEITGAVMETPETRSGGWRCVLRIERVKVSEASILLPCKVLLRGSGVPPKYGDRICASGTARNVPGPRNPGEFDYSAWLERRGIRSEIDIPRSVDVAVIAHGGNFLFHAAQSARDWIAATLSKGIADEPAAVAVIEAMALGIQGPAPDAIEEAFRQTGTLHLFSVSGLHMAMVAGILWMVLAAAGISRRNAVFVIVPILIFYLMITGLQAASLRSTVMIAILLSGCLVDRRPLPLNSLASAAFLILLADTNQLFSVGFQLSFVVVTAILCLAPVFEKAVGNRLAPDPFIPRQLISKPRRFLSLAGREILKAGSVSLAACAGSLPLILWYFHLVTPSALAANVVIIPMAFGVVALAMLSTFCGFISCVLASMINHSNLIVTRALMATVSWFAGLPGSYFHVGAPEWNPPVARVVVFDCGAGGSAAIRSAGKTWLIDCGSSRFAASTLISYLHSVGADRIDRLFLTHGDAGHVGGAIGLLSALRTLGIVEPATSDRSSARNQLSKFLESAGSPSLKCSAGHSIELTSGVALRILHPTPDAAASRADDKCMVVRLDACGIRILFLSDSGNAVESWLLENCPGDLACDIVVKGQHSSGISGGEDFLRAASPSVIIAGGAQFPESEKIRESWARRVKDLGIDLFRQDQSGAVIIDVRNGCADIRGFVDHRHSHATPQDTGDFENKSRP